VQVWLVQNDSFLLVQGSFPDLFRLDREPWSRFLCLLSCDNLPILKHLFSVCFDCLSNVFPRCTKFLQAVWGEFKQEGKVMECTLEELRGVQVTAMDVFMKVCSLK
jgi:hypothetical protein